MKQSSPSSRLNKYGSSGNVGKTHLRLTLPDGRIPGAHPSTTSLRVSETSLPLFSGAAPKSLLLRSTLSYFSSPQTPTSGSPLPSLGSPSRKLSQLVSGFSSSLINSNTLRPSPPKKEASRDISYILDSAGGVGRKKRPNMEVSADQRALLSTISGGLGFQRETAQYPQSVNELRACAANLQLESFRQVLSQRSPGKGKRPMLKIDIFKGIPSEFCPAPTQLKQIGTCRDLPRSADLSEEDCERYATQLGIPSGRSDALAILAWFGSITRRLGTDSSLSTEERLQLVQAIYYISYREVARQVSVHCYERGALMWKIWKAYLALIGSMQEHWRHKIEKKTGKRDQLIKKMREEFEGEIARYKEEVPRLAEENDKKVAELAKVRSNLQSFISKQNADREAWEEQMKSVAAKLQELDEQKEKNCALNFELLRLSETLIGIKRENERLTHSLSSIENAPKKRFADFAVQITQACAEQSTQCAPSAADFSTQTERGRLVPMKSSSRLVARKKSGMLASPVLKVGGGPKRRASLRPDMAAFAQLASLSPKAASTIKPNPIIESAEEAVRPPGTQREARNEGRESVAPDRKISLAIPSVNSSLSSSSEQSSSLPHAKTMVPPEPAVVPQERARPNDLRIIRLQSSAANIGTTNPGKLKCDTSSPEETKAGDPKEPLSAPLHIELELENISSDAEAEKEEKSAAASRLGSGRKDTTPIEGKGKHEEIQAETCGKPLLGESSRQANAKEEGISKPADAVESPMDPPSLTHTTIPSAEGKQAARKESHPEIERPSEDRDEVADMVVAPSLPLAGCETPISSVSVTSPIRGLRRSMTSTDLFATPIAGGRAKWVAPSEPQTPVAGKRTYNYKFAEFKLGRRREVRKKRDTKFVQELKDRVMRQGVKVAPMPRKTLLKQICYFYNELIGAMKKKESDCQCLAVYIYADLANRYGLKKVADQKFLQILTSCMAYKTVFRIRMFGRLLGLYDEYGYNELRCFLDTLQYLRTSYFFPISFLQLDLSVYDATTRRPTNGCSCHTSGRWNTPDNASSPC